MPWLETAINTTTSKGEGSAKHGNQHSSQNRTQVEAGSVNDSNSQNQTTTRGAKTTTVQRPSRTTTVNRPVRTSTVQQPEKVSLRTTNLPQRTKTTTTPEIVKTKASTQSQTLTEPSGAIISFTVKIRGGLGASGANPPLCG